MSLFSNLPSDHKVGVITIICIAIMICVMIVFVEGSDGCNSSDIVKVRSLTEICLTQNSDDNTCFAQAVEAVCPNTNAESLNE